MSSGKQTSRVLERVGTAALACIAILSSLAVTPVFGADQDYLYKFPCEPNVTCFVTTGLHGSSGFAIDFDIGGGSVNGTIVAMSEGTIDFFIDDNECTYPNTPQSRGIFGVITDAQRSSTYAHLTSTISNPSFPTVLQGDPVGIEGDTGYTYHRDDHGNVIPCGVHLHWDPAAVVLIEGRSTASLCAICSYSSTNSWIGDPTEAFFPETAIRNAYRANGGWAKVGWTVDAGNRGDNALYPHPWPPNTPCGTEQNFKKDEGATAGVSGVYASASNPSAAYWVQPDFAAVWWALQDPCSLGYPTSNKGPCPSGSPQGCVALQQFEGGFIWTDGVSIYVYSADLYVVSDDGSAPDHYRRLTPGASWVLKDGQAPDRALNLKYFGNGALFHVVNATGGQIRRSLDSGETWTILATPDPALKPVDLDRSPDGRIWSLWQGSGGLGKIYYSDTNGDDWTFSKDIVSTSGFYPGSISASKSDANRIAIAWVIGSTSLRLTISTNRGADWTTRSPGLNGGIYPFVHWSGPRLILEIDLYSTLNLYVSDNDGIAWSQVQSFPNAPSSTTTLGLIQAVPAGVIFGFVAASDTSPRHIILRSVDNGSSWENVGAIPSGQLNTPKAIAYDEATDVLYVSWLCCLNPGRRVTSLTAASSRDWAAVTASDWQDMPRLAESPAVRGLVIMGDR